MHIDNYKNVFVITLPVGQLKTNCYLLADKNSKKTLIIDPGDDAEFIERIVSDNKLLPQKILATHGHFDHILAVTELQLVYQIPFLAQKKDEFLIKNMHSSGQHFLGINTGPVPHIDQYLDKKLTIEKIEIKIIETPGHTPGSICLYLEKEKIVFAGDLIFAGGAVGRTDLSYSSKKDLDKSVVKILKLSKDTYVYPGHGEPFVLEEFESKPFLE